MYKKILVPLDGSELAECVLPHVESIAHGCSVKEVVLIRVVESFNPTSSGEGFILSEETVKNIDSQNKTEAQNYLAKFASKLNYEGVNVHSELLGGKAAETISEYATNNEVDLIVIATHGRSGISRWVMGSVADRVLRSACVPVLMVRAPGCFPGI